MSVSVRFPQALLSEVALPVDCIEEYELRGPMLKGFVDDVMMDVIRKDSLIPPGAEVVMRNNHRQHVLFMGAALQLRSPELFLGTIPWVYQTYRKHGFSYHYFACALENWMMAIRTHLTAGSAEAILPVYNWILTHHEDWVRLAEEICESPHADSLSTEQAALLEILLNGQHSAAMDFLQREVTDPDAVAPFYRDMLHPVLYEVGRRWQIGQVTVAEEHMASAIVARMMAGMPFVTAPCRSRTPARAIVSTAQQETHELGAWMISDLLHLKQDWNVHYVGADTPIADLLSMTEKVQPSLIALSVTMVFHLPHIARFVRDLRQNDTFSQTKVLVGGQAFQMVPDLWRATHADAYALTLDAALEQVSVWQRDAA